MIGLGSNGLHVTGLGSQDTKKMLFDVIRLPWIFKNYSQEYNVTKN